MKPVGSLFSEHPVVLEDFYLLQVLCDFN